MKPDSKECGKRIQQLRNEKGITQEELAEKLNVSWNTIAKIECGLRKPSIDFLIELSLFFETSINYLVLGVPLEEVENKARIKEIEDTIQKIDEAIEMLLEEKEKLLQQKAELKKQ